MDIPLLLWIIALVLLSGIVGFVVGYNRLVRFRNRMREGWSGIEVQLKRRHDLIPNLVSAVQAYQKHERSTLSEITAQRQAAREAHGVVAASKAESTLGGGLGKLLAVVEAYPDLKADRHFRDLMAELVETENAIQYARRYYNGAVRDLNNGLESFPSNLIGKVGSFQKSDFFEVENASEREGVAVKL